MRNPGFTADCRRKSEGPANEDEAGTQRKRFQHVTATADPAVQHDRKVGAGLHNVRKDLQWGYRTVELSAPMI